jgi:hypothetical protein
MQQFSSLPGGFANRRARKGARASNPFSSARNGVPEVLTRSVQAAPLAGTRDRHLTRFTPDARTVEALVALLEAL